jgi:hypothetical protein
MATRFIISKASRLYEGSTGGQRRMVLIFDDEVETTGPPIDGRTPVEFRGRPGFVLEHQLGSSSRARDILH